MAGLGLNEHHQATTINYLRFARYQRGQRLRAVNLSFQEVKDSRLNEDTYTLDEVIELLDGLLEVVRGEVESEFINTSHTNTLLLRQLFQQAEEWHLKLHADISELENRELLEKIKLFEERQFSGVKGQDVAPKLEPMNEGGGAALLKMEIERLREENSRLREQLGLASSHGEGAEKNRQSLQSELARTQAMLAQASSQKGYKDECQIEDLRQRMTQLQAQMNQTSKSSHETAEKLEGELTGTKHELLKIKEMLEMAEKELEKKVGQTAPFRNLKQMLQKKNEQIKDLRRRLSKYESLDD